MMSPALSLLFFFTYTAPTEIYTLSLHDALPIWARCFDFHASATTRFNQIGSWLSPVRLPLLLTRRRKSNGKRSEEHTSELQSHSDLVCRLLLEKKKKKEKTNMDETVN